MKFALNDKANSFNDSHSQEIDFLIQFLFLCLSEFNM